MRSVVVHRHHSPSGLGNLMQRLTNTDYRRVPWKNGLGSTLELASDATTPGGPWTWRFSLADVPSRAAFSHFPGINRHLAVLDGQGMTVDRDGAHPLRIALPADVDSAPVLLDDRLVAVGCDDGTLYLIGE